MIAYFDENNMEKKYELTDETKITEDGVTVYRIRALRSFGRVYGIKAGTIGGYVESEHNLSHDGDCWISDDAVVYGKAIIHGGARISCCAQVFGNAEVYGTNTIVDGEARIYDNAKVYNALVGGVKNVCGHEELCNRRYV